MSAELQAWRSAGVGRETAPPPAGAPNAAWTAARSASNTTASSAPAHATRQPDRQTGRQAGQKALRWAAATVAAALAFVAVPQWASDYWLSAILIPFLVLSLAGLGLNLLTGYAGQLSVGSAAFMAVGAFATYNFALRVPGLPLLGAIALGGGVAALLGALFGLPALRIRGFYLIVSTLAAQFLIQWVLVKFSWLSNDSASGVITAPPLVVAGVHLDHPAGRYLLTLSIVAVLTLLARNLVHSATGRRWQAVRDHETAAALMGVPVGATKVLAFAISSFYLGVAGALWAFAYLGTVEPHGFDLTRSFEVLFIAILGGLGSLSGAFLGAAVIGLLPIGLSLACDAGLGGAIDPGQLQNLQKILFGALIIAFLIKEPRGLAHALAALLQRLRGPGPGAGTRPAAWPGTPLGARPHEPPDVPPDASRPAAGPACPG